MQKKLNESLNEWPDLEDIVAEFLTDEINRKISEGNYTWEDWIEQDIQLHK